MRLICQVYKSSVRTDMYLYVDKSCGLCDVPEELLIRFGEPMPVMLFELTPARKLARVSALDVLEAIRERGFFLQMPPTAADFMGQGE